LQNLGFEIEIGLDSQVSGCAKWWIGMHFIKSRNPPPQRRHFRKAHKYLKRTAKASFGRDFTSNDVEIRVIRDLAGTIDANILGAVLADLIYTQPVGPVDLDFVQGLHHTHV
jgi:hypothetical protein